MQEMSLKKEASLKKDKVGAALSPRPTLRLLLGGAVIVGFAHCGGSASTPTVSPTPQPTPQPTPLPTPTPGLPAGMTCSPTPPPLLRMQVKIHGGDPGRFVLDSKPVVPNIDHYCARVGFGDWKFCDTRPEGDPEHVACDYMATGRSADTGRWGPTWYYQNEPCSQSTHCANHATNQFLAIAKGAGNFEACAADDIPVAEDGTRCGGIEIK